MKNFTKAKHLWVGITGGIGSGKSTVSRYLAESGHPVLSADEINRELTQPGAAALGEISQVFGAQAIAADGSLDRAFMRAEITREPALRLKLEAIMHPRIQQLSKERADELFAQDKRIVFYEAPLLFEARGEKALDLVVCVHARDELRIERTVKRDRCSREQAEKLLLSQMPQAEKMAKSDYLISNEGDESILKTATLAVLGQLQKLLAN